MLTLRAIAPVQRTWECVVYSVFGDESADDTKARVFAVSGVFGNESDWNDLKGPWLERTGGKTFHAVDCDSDGGDYRGIDHSENKALYKDLTQLLCRSRLMARSFVMDLDGWNTYFPDTPQDMPYLICFRNVVYECGDLGSKLIPQDTMEFTFDQRPETNYNAGVLYSYMVNLKKWDANTFLRDKVSFATKDHVGIQAADLVAREAMKHLDNEIGPVKRGVRLSMQALLETKRFAFTQMRREFFEQFIRNRDTYSRQLGIDTQDFMQWLDEKGLDYNMSNVHLYMIEKWPPGTN